MQVRGDGLYCLAQVTERGERVLAENPRLGVSARIVEQYNRADGKYYPAAIQHVLGTLDPRIPALGAWEPTDLANDATMIIDLSQASFAGDTPPDTDTDELTDQELAELIDALDDEDLAELDDGELSDDELEALVDSLTDAELDQLEAEAAADGDYDDALGELSAAFSNQYATAQARASARAEADELDRLHPAVRTEDVLARALSRASQGTYTSEAALASQNAAIALSSQAGFCGPLDPVTGVCGSRFHELGCAGYAAGSDGQVLLANYGASALEGLALSLSDPGREEDGIVQIPAATIELAAELNESWGLHSPTAHGYDPEVEDLFSTSRSRDAYSDMAREVGHPELAEHQPGYDGYPPVGELARELGLR
jgi:hypothetical protein